MRVIGLAVVAIAALLGLGVASGLVVVTRAPVSVPTVRPMQPLPTQKRTVRTDAGTPLRVPVTGVAPAALRDDWGEPRGGGTRPHHGLDIPAPSGTLVVAAGPGRVEKLFESTAGGTTLYERSADGQWLYYYAHLSGYAPGVHEGQAVRAGDPIGYVGDTGDAGPGNYHLHFGLSRAAGKRWWEGEDVDPFPYLRPR